jgi:hypothetical protein
MRHLSVMAARTRSVSSDTAGYRIRRAWLAAAAGIVMAVIGMTTAFRAVTDANRGAWSSGIWLAISSPRSLLRF